MKCNVFWCKYVVDVIFLGGRGFGVYDKGVDVLVVMEGEYIEIGNYGNVSLGVLIFVVGFG